MAFKGGQPIQAGLGAANFSPILQGGIAQGNAYASVGQNVGQGLLNAVQTFQQKQAQKEQTDAAIQMMQQRFGVAPDAASAAVKAVGPTNALNFFAQESQAEDAARAAALNRLGTIMAVTQSRGEGGKIDASSAYAKASEYGVMDFSLLDQIIDNANKGPSTVVNVGGEGKPSAFEEELGKKAAAVYSDWTLGGGRARLVDNVQKFERVIDTLESGEADTRTIVEFLPVGNDYVRSLFEPTTSDVVDRIRGVAFQTLRETLGAQFTEREGQRLVESYFNPRLSEEANIERLKDFVRVNKQVIEAKDDFAQYAEREGTIRGFEGQYVWDIDDIRDELGTEIAKPTTNFNKVSEEERQAISQLPPEAQEAYLKNRGK